MEEFFDEERRAMHLAYLRECGIIGKLNDIFRKLLQGRKRPHDLLNFVREELGDKPTPTEIVENMEHELDEAHREIRRLRGILKELGVNITDKQLYEADSASVQFEGVITLREFMTLYDEETDEQHTQQTN